MLIAQVAIDMHEGIRIGAYRQGDGGGQSLLICSYPATKVTAGEPSLIQGDGRGLPRKTILTADRGRLGKISDSVVAFRPNYTIFAKLV
jgi:hypothetical protein